MNTRMNTGEMDKLKDGFRQMSKGINKSCIQEDEIIFQDESEIQSREVAMERLGTSQSVVVNERSCQIVK